MATSSAAAVSEESILSYLEDSSNSRALLVESGHHIHVEQPEVVAEAIDEVVRVLETTGSGPRP